MTKKILFIFGTRPEAIKMAPLIFAFRRCALFETQVCVTGQHRDMLDQVLTFFDITPEYDLNLMTANQTIFDITILGLKGIESVLETARPDCIFVQGDTTSAFIGALGGFYRKIPIAHIEAGLRSHHLYSPFPEEANRKLVGHIATFHFTPTSQALDNLKREGICENVFLVGNTVIDALLLGITLIQSQGDHLYRQFFQGIDFDRKVILVTGHRRESFGQPFYEICQALKNISVMHPDVEIVYPVHLNPQVRDPVYSILQGCSNVHLLEPLTYPYLIWLMKQSYLVLTDSGGIQEEAPSLGKPVLVMRDITERMEGVQAGTAKLVGTERLKIVEETSLLLLNRDQYELMSNSTNPYGDGRASEAIVRIMEQLFG